MGYFILLFLCAVGAYLIGSINVSVIVSKLAYKGDVRKYGSGNAGATNMARVYGLWGGLIVLIGDFGKGIVSTVLASVIGNAIFGVDWGNYCLVVASVACMLGHAFPVFFGFKGGKAVTVGAAVSIMIDWRFFLIAIGIFIIMFIITHIVSASSICAAFGLCITSIIFYFVEGALPVCKLILSIFTGIFIIVLHHQNVKRLLRGEEKKFTYKKKQKEECDQHQTDN